MTDPRPASERAADLRARILAVVEAGKFRLEHKTFYLRVTETGACGCAVGIGAYALGAVAPVAGEPFWRCMDALRPLATPADVNDLEGGFENWDDCDESNPFAALGVELRSLAEKAAP